MKNDKAINIMFSIEIIVLMILICNLGMNGSEANRSTTHLPTRASQGQVMICPSSIYLLSETQGFAICRYQGDYFLYNTRGPRLCGNISKVQITKKFRSGMNQHGCPRKVMREVLEYFSIPATIEIPTVHAQMPCDSMPCQNGGTCSERFNKQQGRIIYICKCPQPGYRPKDNCASCAPGWYGFECRKRCGDCAYPPCNYTTGDCPHGRCASEELRPPKCKDRIVADEPGRSSESSGRKRSYQVAFNIQANTTLVKRATPASVRLLKAAMKRNIIHSICQRHRTAFCVDMKARDIVVTPQVKQYYQGWEKLRQNAEEFNDNQKGDNITRRSALIRNFRQADAPGTTIIKAEIKMQIPEEVTQGRGDFAEVIAANLKQDAPNFDLGDGYTVDSNSIQVKEVSAPRTVHDDSAKPPSLPVIAAVLCVSLVAGAMLLIAIRGLQRNRNSTKFYRDTGVGPWIRLENKGTSI